MKVLWTPLPVRVVDWILTVRIGAGFMYPINFAGLGAQSSNQSFYTFPEQECYLRHVCIWAFDILLVTPQRILEIPFPRMTYPTTLLQD